MIVVDTSILIAILQSEPEAKEFIEVLNENDVCLPATVLVEANILAMSRGLETDLYRLIMFLTPVIVPIDEQIAQRAVAAHRRYGKGRHKASLNFGDCLSYATAKSLQLPLFYKGDDFGRTDVAMVAAG